MMLRQVCLFCLAAMGSVALAKAAATTAPARAETKKKLETRTKQTIEFDAGGEIRLENTIGDVSVVGWDKSEVELVVSKATKKYYASDEEEKALKQLERFSVTLTKEDERRLLVSVAPARSLLGQLLNGAATNLELSFTLRVPKTSNLRVAHRGGDLRLKNIVGDISVSNRAGDVSVALSGDEKYAIDAKSRIGEVRSAFRRKKEPRAGTTSRPADADRAYKVRLRVGVGEIRVEKLTR